MWLYHATFRRNIASIREMGLGAKQKKNWDISMNNVVCLALDPAEANDYCECAEDVSDSVYESGIVVFAVNTKDLNRQRLMQDPNLRDVESYIYQGIIPSDKLYVITDTKGIVGKLSEVKRVPAFYR